MTASDQRQGSGRSVLGSSAVMAVGTVFSRVSGLGRSVLLMAALGSGLHGDVFNIANTVPNMLYILLAGGVFNAVLVPQLVRAQREDPDGGDAYTSRLITLAAIFLAAVSALLVLGAPLLMRLFLDPAYFTAGLAEQRDSVIALARYCLPQVFFYGMFVLVGQVLNARGSFGPMMWAPIVNNVVSVAVLIGYLVVYGSASGPAFCGGYDPGQELLLGLGSTAGIALQLLVLVPYLRKAGYRFSARTDFRGAGLGHTFRLGLWTVLFVVVNQVAYTVVVKLASGGTVPTAAAGCTPGGTGTGYTVYSNAYLLVMVPHSVITVSLATAILPLLSRHAAAGRLGDLGRELSATLRTTYAVVLPLLAVLPVVAPDVADLVFGYGAGASTFGHFVPTLSLFAVGMLFFTTHYLSLRGFYALEQNRRVFFNQCWVSATNIAVALVLVHAGPPEQVAPRLVVAYAAAYAVGATLSVWQLRRQVGGLDGRRLVRFAVRMVIAVILATAATWAASRGAAYVVPDAGKPGALLRLAVAAVVDLGVLLGAARLMRITEVTEVTGLLTARLRRRPRA